MNQQLPRAPCITSPGVSPSTNTRASSPGGKNSLGRRQLELASTPGADAAASTPEIDPDATQIAPAMDSGTGGKSRSTKEPPPWGGIGILLFGVVRARIKPPFISLAPLHCPHCCNTIARLLLGIRPPPSTSIVYAIHHTILVITISCKG